MLKPASAREVMDRIRPYCEGNPSISRVAIFGSYARGDQGPDSDVDLLVSLSPSERMSLVGISGMKRDLGDLLGSDVDVVTSLTDAAPCFVEDIRRDGKIIYER